MSWIKNNLLQLISISCLSLIAWYKILNQVFQGEGYMYFNNLQQFIDWNGLHGIWSYNNFARGLFDIFSPIFHDNIQAYQILMLVIMNGIYFSLYFIVEKITKNRMIAWTATIFFALNYAASFTLVGTGTYQRFAERLPIFIPLLFSFYFLYFAFTKKFFRYYLTSLGLYSFAVFMGHFASLFLPLFVIYPFVTLINIHLSKKEIIIRLLTTSLFVIATILITSHSDQPASRSLLDFFEHEPDLIKRTFYQIPMFTIPLDIFPYLANLFSPKLRDPYTILFHYFTLFCLGIYLLGFFLVIKNNRHLLVLYLTSFFAMIGCMLLYMYIDSRLNVLIYFGADRFYFIPSILAAISGAIILQSITKKITISIILTFVFVTAFVMYNTNTIWKQMDIIQYKSESLKRFINYTISLSPKFTNQTVLVIPSYLQWPMPIITEFHSPKGMKIIIDTDGWQEKLWPNKDNVFVIDYDYEREATKDFESNKGHVIDLTHKYRSGEKIKFLN